MSCEEYEQMASRLIDGEVSPGESAEIFAHLASCEECRRFFHKVQELHGSLQRFAEPPIPASGLQPLTFRPAPAIAQRGFWLRQVSLRMPVVVATACIMVAAVIFALKRNQEPERVFITELPTVVVAADGTVTTPVN
jgi:predicted anti-sigma-YlaC factor YlaD